MQPITISIPDEVLGDLHRRLEAARLPDQIDGIGWDQGTERGFLVELITHWRDNYDWRATEDRLGHYEQLVTEVDGQRIHLMRVPSRSAGALPLLITHGWPGSVLEFLDVLEPLREHFELVVPSLPGFTFSGPTSERGWHPRRIAAAFAEVMERLGHDHYGLQGGDWGSLVSANLADLHPDRVTGLHVNMVTSAPPVPDAPITEEEHEALERARIWRLDQIGYQEIQGTRPQTLGYGLEDSPVGLAAWIVEKFREWSDGDITEAFTLDRLLDNVTAYWVTGTATSSCRIYWEMRQADGAASRQRRVEVPTGVAMFPGEAFYPPRSWVEDAYNVVRWSTPARGGHFAAMEAPDEYVADVTSFFRSLA